LLYDTQLLAGLALARGAIAEMQTGEGKTLSALLPAVLFALTGRGVHVATPNAYLAKRDYELLEPVYALLGMRCGLLREQGSDAAKLAAYESDVTYGTGYEFGFDLLRDELGRLTAELPLGQALRDALRGRPAAAPIKRQRGHAFAIIDEIDSVLLDEACMPLVLSTQPGANGPAAEAYQAARSAAGLLRAGDDYLLDLAGRSVRLTQGGLKKVHANPLATRLALERPWAMYIEQALAARLLYKLDVDYVVQDQKLMLVDQCTGRIFADRTWRDGLHQSVEAEAGLPITTAQGTAARISRQRYYRQYETVCGMTGTAAGGEREVWSLYRLPVVVIPPRRPSRRVELPTRWFVDVESKLRSAAAEVQAVHRTGRPILIGSRTIENSRLVADRLAKCNLPFNLLNGRQDAEEATIIAQAGSRGAITIATNMAGRGTDIKLAPGVAHLGGMHMLAIERNQSPRIDRQLSGRVGRQGEPGSSQFLISAEDELIATHAPALARRMRQSANIDGEIQGDFSSQVAALQRQLEAEHYAARRQMLAYDKWLDEGPWSKGPQKP